MTGEITLTGRSPDRGRPREGARGRACGPERVILPLENVHDLDDLPAETRAELEFVLVDHVEEVFEDAFRKARRQAAPGPGTLDRQAASARRSLFARIHRRQH